MARISENKKWEQESDAHTLAEAEKIKGDKSRLSGAKTAAKRMANEQQKHADAMAKVAKSGRTTTSNTKTGRSIAKKK